MYAVKLTCLRRPRTYEKPKAFELIREDFTVENGLLTPSLKVRRKLVLDLYLPKLEGLYTANTRDARDAST